MTVLGLVWAQSTSGVIGRGGDIPWRVPEDMAHFKRVTLGHPVLMGRRTWESLPAAVRPLPGRRNAVPTRRAASTAAGADVLGSPDEAIAGCAGELQAWVIGGGQIYAQALEHAARCEVTEVDVELPRDDDDALAPVLDDAWVGETGAWQVSRAGLRYRFHSYSRR